MNSTLIIVIGLIIINTASFMVLNEFESKKDLKEPEVDLMHVVISILNDPEFNTLDNLKQLRILIAIYNILQEKLAKQTVFRAKRDLT